MAGWQRLGCWLVALFSCLTPAVAQTATPTDIYAEPGIGPLVIDVRIGGRIARMEVDTGSASVTLQPSAAVRIGLLGTLPDSGEQLKATVKAGGASFENVPVEIKTLFVDGNGKEIDYRGFDGLIGLSLLSSCALGIDTVQRKITLWPGGQLSDAVTADWLQGKPKSEPLSVMSDNGSVWYRLCAWVNGKKGDYILDTGAPFMLVTQGQAKGLGKFRDLTGDFQFVGFNSGVDFGIANDLLLPWRDLASPLVGVLQPDNRYGELISHRKTAGLIGWESLSGTRTIIDFPAKKVSSVVSADWVAWEDWLYSFGFRIGQLGRESGLIVLPGGRAEQAGLRTGDLLLEIEGKPVVAGVIPNPYPDWKPASKIKLKTSRFGHDIDTVLIHG